MAFDGEGKSLGRIAGPIESQKGFGAQTLGLGRAPLGSDQGSQGFEGSQGLARVQEDPGPQDGGGWGGGSQAMSRIDILEGPFKIPTLPAKFRSSPENIGVGGVHGDFPIRPYQALAW